MNAVRRRSTTAVLLAAVLLAAGCSGDSVRFLGEKVKEPEQFLASIEQDWRSELSKERVNVHKEARCYFSRGEESKDIDGLAFCGPARHFVDEETADGEGELTGTDAPDAVNNGVWDTYSFSGEAIEGGYQLVNPTPETRGAVVSPGVALFRLDDKQPPADGDKLAAPPPPPAKPGFIGVTSGGSTNEAQVSSIDTVKIDKPFKLTASTLTTPRFQYRITSAGTADRVTTLEGARTPAAGEEFVVAQFSSSAGWWNTVYNDLQNSSTYNEPFPSGELVSAIPTFTLVTSTGRVDVPFNDGEYVVASVPKGDSTVSLEVVSAGRVQSLSFRTGKVTGRFRRHRRPPR